MLPWTDTGEEFQRLPYGRAIHAIADGYPRAPASQLQRDAAAIPLVAPVTRATRPSSVVTTPPPFVLPKSMCHQAAYPVLACSSPSGAGRRILPHGERHRAIDSSAVD